MAIRTGVAWERFLVADNDLKSVGVMLVRMGEPNAINGSLLTCENVIYYSPLLSVNAGLCQEKQSCWVPVKIRQSAGVTSSCGYDRSLKAPFPLSIRAEDRLLEHGEKLVT